MIKYLVNFATPNFYKSQKILNNSAIKFGIDKTISWNKKQLKKTGFYKKNKEILNQKRGVGFWLWKPYIILDLINKINEGDLILYSDSGIEIINDLNPLFKICQRQEQNGVILFTCGGHINKIWTKRDCFVLMDCDSKKYWDHEQTLGSFQIYIKNKNSIKFLKEWLFYCQNKYIITDMSNISGLPNFPEFKDHRHDQSILSILAVKYSKELFRDPTQWGNYLKMTKFRKPHEFLITKYSDNPLTNSTYFTLLNHHRKRDMTISNKINIKILKRIKRIIHLIINFIKLRGIKK